MKKLKLKSAMRDKRRYFLVRATSDKIEAAILKYIGVLGFAKSAYQKVEGRGWKVDSSYVVGSCLAKSLNDVRAGLALAGIRIKRVSGTLRGLRKNL